MFSESSYFECQELMDVLGTIYNTILNLKYYRRHAALVLDNTQLRIADFLVQKR